MTQLPVFLSVAFGMSSMAGWLVGELAALPILECRSMISVALTFLGWHWMLPNVWRIVQHGVLPPP